MYLYDVVQGIYKAGMGRKKGICGWWFFPFFFSSVLCKDVTYNYIGREYCYISCSFGDYARRNGGGSSGLCLFGLAYASMLCENSLYFIFSTTSLSPVYLVYLQMRNVGSNAIRLMVTLVPRCSYFAIDCSICIVWCTCADEERSSRRRGKKTSSRAWGISVSAAE